MKSRVELTVRRSDQVLEPEGGVQEDRLEQERCSGCCARRISLSGVTCLTVTVLGLLDEAEQAQALQLLNVINVQEVLSSRVCATVCDANCRG